MMFDESVLKRFSKKVSHQHESGCHQWLGAPSTHGYGNLRVNKKKEMAHRISYLINVGEIPHGLCVLHKCDNRMCVNPEHLFLGTNQENTQDKVNKGRQVKGDDHGKSTIDCVTAKKIKNLRNSSLTQTYVANLFNVSRFIVRDICIERTWRHVA